MDDSEKYIKMCEKAAEIQALRVLDSMWKDWDYFSAIYDDVRTKKKIVNVVSGYDTDGGYMGTGLEEGVLNKGSWITSDLTWLPRVDQIFLLNTLVGEYKDRN